MYHALLRKSGAQSAGCPVPYDLSLLFDGSGEYGRHANDPLKNLLQAKAIESVKAFLGHKLPAYLIPSDFVLLEQLPRTPNGKIDRKALPAPNRVIRGGVYEAPRNPIEKLLASLWAEVLQVERVGIEDDFFALGGDSISSIRVAVALERAGYKVNVKDFFTYSTLQQLAQCCTRAALPVHAPQGIMEGEQPLVPVQRWFFAQDFRTPQHWNQSFLLAVPPDLEFESLEGFLHVLVQHHDALRLRFIQQGGRWVAYYGDASESVAVERHDLGACAPEEVAAQIERVGYEAKSRLDLGRGPLVRAVLFPLGSDRPARLLWTIHHLVVNTVSWRVLLEDLEQLQAQWRAGETLRLTPKSTPYQYWGERLDAYARGDALSQELAYWTRPAWRDVAPIPVDFVPDESANVAGWVRAHTVTLDETHTRALLEQAHAAYHTQINDFLLCALVRAYANWSGQSRLLLHLEGHGREELFEEVDLGRTVGWFTTIYPVLLESAGLTLADDLKAVKEQLRAVPRKGIGYGLLRYLRQEALPALTPAIAFNYLGQFDQTFADPGTFRFAREASGLNVDVAERGVHILDIEGSVFDHRLSLRFYYSPGRHREATIARLAEDYQETLTQLIDHCLSPQAGGWTPFDFPLANFTVEGLEAVLTEVGSQQDPRRIEAIYPLSPLQEGMLFESLKSTASGVYVNQAVLTLRGSVDPLALQAAWRDVIGHFPALRTAFAYQGQARPQQVVFSSVEFALAQEDWRAGGAEGREARLQAFLQKERGRGFDFARAPLFTVVLVRVADDEYRLLWNHHHILLDGWSIPHVYDALAQAYEARRRGQPPTLRHTEPYEAYIRWLQAQDPRQAEAFWREYLAGFEDKTALPLVRSERPEGLKPGVSYASREFTLPGALYAALDENARQHRLTLNTFVQFAWGLLLSRYTGSHDVLFGAVTSGRSPDLRGAESIVGLLINTVPVRLQTDARRQVIDRTAPPATG